MKNKFVGSTIDEVHQLIFGAIDVEAVVFIRMHDENDRKVAFAKGRDQLGYVVFKTLVISRVPSRSDLEGILNIHDDERRFSDGNGFVEEHGCSRFYTEGAGSFRTWTLWPRLLAKGLRNELFDPRETSAGLLRVLTEALVTAALEES